MFALIYEKEGSRLAPCMVRLELERPRNRNNCLYDRDNGPRNGSAKALFDIESRALSHGLSVYVYRAAARHESITRCRPSVPAKWSGCVAIRFLLSVAGG